MLENLIPEIKLLSVQVHALEAAVQGDFACSGQLVKHIADDLNRQRAELQMLTDVVSCQKREH